MPQQRRGRPRSLDLEVERKIAELIEPKEGVGVSSAAQLFRELQKAAGAPNARFALADIPSQRSVLNYFNEAVLRDESGTWTLAVDTERPDFLLQTLRARFDRSGGEAYSLSRDAADWIERIVRALPDIAPLPAFGFAKEYLRCTQTGKDIDHLDFSLAMAPTVDDVQAGEAEIKRLGVDAEELFTQLWSGQQQVPAPISSTIKRIVGHIDLHAREWSNQTLTMWPRCEWIAHICMQTAVARGGYMIAWDDRDDVHFLQLKL